MAFPVDLLADRGQAELQRSAQNYMNDLLHGDPESPQRLALADSSQITIDISSVGFIPLYGSSDQHRVLALFSPTDPLTAVALYLLDQWWTVDDILKTADPARDGPVEVETVGERIVLYILNRVVYRAKEMRSEELPFLCHGEKDHAKILWSDGEAVGFYSVKPSGSLWNSFSSRSYQLPVMDSIFVRKRWRGQGFGLLMLEDFVLSYRDDHLGLRYPLSVPMYKVCEKYLCQYPGDTDLLWEVEGIGRPNQRTKISRRIQTFDLSAVSKSLSFTEEPALITEVTEKERTEDVITHIEEPTSMECTIGRVEEVAALRETKEAEVPVSARGRSSGSKRLRNLAEKITESEKVIRIEDIEAETPREENVPGQQKTEVQDPSGAALAEAIFIVTPEEHGEHVIDPPPEGGAVLMSDTAATIRASQDLDEAHVPSGSATEEPQGGATSQRLTTSQDSQVTVENVSSDAEKDGLNEDAPVLVISEDVLEAHQEAEPTEKSAEVMDEKLRETVTQHWLKELTHTTPGDDEAGKAVEAIKTVQSDAPIRRAQRRFKPEAGLMEQSTAQEGGRVPRAKTVRQTVKHTPKRRYTRHGQKARQELEKELDETADEMEVSAPAEDLPAAGGEEPEDMTSTQEVVAVEGSRAEELKQLTAEQRGALVQDAELGSPDVQHVSTEGSTEPQTQEEEHMAEADLKGQGGLASEETPADAPMGERHQVPREEAEGPEDVAADDDVPPTEAPVIDAVKEPEVLAQAAEKPQEEDAASEAPWLQEAAATAVAEEEQDVVEERPETMSTTAAHEEETSGEECKETPAATGGKEVEPSPVFSDEEPMTMTEEEEGPAGLMAVTDAVHEGASLPRAAGLPPSEDKKTVSAEEQRSKGPAPQRSDLQRVTVVLVDWKKTHHDVQKEMAAVNQDVPVETPSGEIEEEQREVGMEAEEQTEERSPGSSDGLESTELEKDAVTEEGFADKVEDAASIQETGAAETVQECEAEGPYDEEEPTVSKTRPRRSMRQAAKPAPSSKLPKSRRKRAKKEETPDKREEEPLLALGSQMAADEEDEESSPTDERQVEEPEAQENIDKNNEEEPEEESTPTEAEEPKAEARDDSRDEILDEKDVEEPVRQEEVDSQAEVEIPVRESEVESLDRGEGKVTDEEQTPAVVLRSGGKTLNASSSSKTTKCQQDNEQEMVGDKSSNAEEPAVDTRALRKGRRSAATPSTRSSKRARTGPQQDEEDGERTVEETTANSDEKTEEHDDPGPVVQEEKPEPEFELTKVAVVEPPATADEMAEAQSGGANAEEDSPVGQRVEEPSNTPEEEDTDEEEAPAVETRALRRGRRSAAALIPRGKSRRTRTRRQPEELQSPAEVEEPKADDNDDHSDEIMEEGNAEKPGVQKEDNSEADVEVGEAQAVVEHSVAEEEEPPAPETSAGAQEETPVGESVEGEEAPVVEARVLRSGGKAGKTTASSKTSENEEGTVVENSSDTEEPAVETRALRKGRRSAATTSTRRSKRARTGARQDEEVGGAGPEAEMNRPGEVEGVKEASTEEAAALEEARVADESVAPGEAPAASGTFPEEEAKELTENQQAETDETSPTEGNSEEREVQPEKSPGENVRENTATAESAAAKGNVLNLVLVLDTDEEAETKVSSQEFGGVASDEEAEPSVIRKITPRPPSRRHTGQVQVSEESLSDEDQGPVPAQRRLRKRRRRDATPARKSKRLSRV